MSARYAAARRITESRQAGRVEGVLVDTFTASALVAVYEAMNETNRARFDSLPLERLAAFCLSKVSI